MRGRYVPRTELTAARKVSEAAHKQLDAVKALIPGLEGNRATTGVAECLREILNMKKAD